MTTAWLLDFCLVCDRQTFGDAYCSQVCRLSELDQFFPDSAPPSPTSFHASQVSISVRTGREFNVSPSSTASGLTTRMSSYPPRATGNNLSTSSQTRPSGLTTSSSQTSLSSLQSLPSQPSVLSDHVLHELRDYTSCFDQVRDLKRRLTTS